MVCLTLLLFHWQGGLPPADPIIEGGGGGRRRRMIEGGLTPLNTDREGGGGGAAFALHSSTFPVKYTAYITLLFMKYEHNYITISSIQK